MRWLWTFSSANAARHLNVRIQIYQKPSLCLLFKPHFPPLFPCLLFPLQDVIFPCKLGETGGQWACRPSGKDEDKKVPPDPPSTGYLGYKGTAMPLTSFVYGNLHCVDFPLNLFSYVVHRPSYVIRFDFMYLASPRPTMPCLLCLTFHFNKWTSKRK